MEYTRTHGIHGIHDQTIEYLTDNNIFYKYQSALVTTNRGNLLRKMVSLGFSNHSLMWFQSYLYDRSFRVNVKSKYSRTAKIECGVPHGSILGPLLFLLYVNVMKQAVNCDLFL